MRHQVNWASKRVRERDQRSYRFTDKEVIMIEGIEYFLARAMRDVEPHVTLYI